MARDRESRATRTDAAASAMLQKWADGKATLQDVRGYSDEELYSIARTAYFFYFQGRVSEARTLFQGLYAINPLNVYFARALGVVEFAAGNVQGSLAAYDVATRLAPDEAASYVGRAEVNLATGKKSQALEDLRKADRIADENDPLKPKISALLEALYGR